MLPGGRGGGPAAAAEPSAQPRRREVGDRVSTHAPDLLAMMV
jgi:hypothetical protein